MKISPICLLQCCDKISVPAIFSDHQYSHLCAALQSSALSNFAKCKKRVQRLANVTLMPRRTNPVGIVILKLITCVDVWVFYELRKNLAEMHVKQDKSNR